MQYLLIVLWLVFGSIVFGWIRATTPALWVVTLPDIAWNFLLEIFGANCCESVSDVEYAVNLGFGFIFSGIMLLLFLLIRKWLRKSQKSEWLAQSAILKIRGCPAPVLLYWYTEIKNMSVKPRYSELLQHFNVVKGDVSHVGAIVGGKVKLNIDNGVFENACAIRISYALNKAGITIGHRAGETSSGEDKAWYLYRVSALREFLIEKFGKPQTFTPTEARAQLADKKGIILFRVSGWGNALGHFTLWDGSRGRCAGVRADGSTNDCYFPDDHRQPGVSTHSVELWELLP